MLCAFSRQTSENFSGGDASEAAVFNGGLGVVLAFGQGLQVPFRPKQVRVSAMGQNVVGDFDGFGGSEADGGKREEPGAAVGLAVLLLDGGRLRGGRGCGGGRAPSEAVSSRAQPWGLAPPR